MNQAAPKLSAIVLAAGMSRRMQGPNKLLAPLDDRPILAHVLATVTSLQLFQSVLVVGPNSTDIERLASGSNVQIVINPDPQGGMGGSIAAGARALTTQTDGVFVCLGDMPFISARTFADLTRCATTGGDILRETIFVPICDQRDGHPVLFGADHIRSLAQLSGDRGARSILNANRDRVVRVQVDDPGIHQDIDTPEALHDARRKLLANQTVD